MSLLSYKTLACLLIFLTSMATVIVPLKKRELLKHTESLGWGEALASGIFLGAAFFHLLPDAINDFHKLNHALNYPVPEVICVGSFLLMLLLERLTFFNRQYQSVPYVLTLILTVHATIEGAALGITATFTESFMLFFAIIAHKGSESFALCITLIKHQLSFFRVVGIVVFFSCVTPLGILLGAAINSYSVADHGTFVSGVFNAFAAGTFLYIATLHHFHSHHHEEEAHGIVELACLAAGAITMGIIAIWT